MAEFALGTGFPHCWCGCQAERHKLELSGGKLVHTRCNSCRCTQYEPRVDELAPAEPAAAAAPTVEPTAERAKVLPAKLATPPKRRGRPPRTGAAAYAAPGEVLGTWRSWACLSCGSRRFEAHECCGGPAQPVTLTMTRGHDG